MKIPEVLSFRQLTILAFAIALTLLIPITQWAKIRQEPAVKRSGGTQSDSQQDGERNFSARQTMAAAQSGSQCRSSDIAPPEANDTTFVADCPTDGDLDTGCTTGRLVIRLKVPRVLTKDQQRTWIAKGLLSPTARLTLPAYDVDSSKATGCGCANSPEPEFDLIRFNNKEVKNGNGTPYLEGECEKWRLNTFDIPLDWIEFPDDPKENGTATPKENIITIDIDTKNQQKCWCTSVDWVALEIFTPVRPVVLVHGILSWAETWMGKPTPDDPTAISFVERFNQLDVPVSAITLDPVESPLRNLKSIEENAVTIGAAVEASRRRWGMEKVNLLCHSKGGLDSREFVELNEGVDKLVQLGTPNAGSPAADAVQLGGLAITVLTKRPAGLLLNAFAGPAGLQLTTPAMLLYNWTHDLNPKVSYVSIAGDYMPACSIFDPFGCSARRYGMGLRLGLTGRGDTIVPIYSVHALGRARHDGFSTRGDNFEAIHEGLTKSPTAFDLAWRYLIGPSAPAGGMKAADTQGETQTMASETAETATLAPDQQPTLSRTAGVVGILRQGGRQIHSLPISEAKPTVVMLLYPEGNLDLTLISPSGRRFDAQTSINNNQVKRGEGELFGGKFESYAFASPETGQWSIEVSAPAVSSTGGEAGYVVNAWVEGSAIELVGTAANPHVKPGESLELRATPKQSGQSIRGASVIAQVALPDDTVREIGMRDDGAGGDRTANDGTYTGLFTQTQQPGSYRVAYRATGGNGNSTPAFSRETMALATVSRSRSVLTGNYRDYGADTNGDRFFNHLAIDVGVNITAETVYRVFGVLSDSRGNKIEAAVKSRLRAGQNLVTLKFDGETIFRNGVDGPYRLTELRMAEEEKGSILPVDSKTDVYQTRAYKAGDFQRSAISLTGKGNATGVDTNGNRLFDLLRVGVEANLADAGSYTWSARLTDRGGKEIGFATKTGSLRSGVNTLSFDFDGKRIGESGADGPYFLRGLILFGAGASLTAEEVFTTGAFQASQFEGYKVNNPVPALSSIAPATVVAGSPQITLTVKGDKFIKESQVMWNGAARQTVFDSATQLRATIPAADLANPATAAVTVFNPMPAGGASNALSFVISPPPNDDAEQEPNETSAQATPLSFPGQRTGQAAVGDAFHWRINYSDGQVDGLEDFFALTLTQSAGVELKLAAANAAADLDLFLFKEENGRLSYLGYSIHGPGVNDRIVTQTPLAPGRYLVAVSAFSGSSRYTLTAAVPDPRLLYLSFNNSLNGANGETPLMPARGVFTQGVAGSALSMPAGSHLVYGGAGNINSTEGTVELWVKPAWNGNDARHHYILQHGGAGGILIGKDSANNLRLILNRYGARGGGEVDTGFNIADWQANRWYHVAFTWSNSQRLIRIYVNGQLKSSRSFTGSLPAINNDRLQIGGDGASGYLEAVIDELSIHGNALSAQEIAARYNTP